MGFFDSLGNFLKRKSTQIVGTAATFFCLGVAASRTYDYYNTPEAPAEPELEPEPEVEYAE